MERAWPADDSVAAKRARRTVALVWGVLSVLLSASIGDPPAHAAFRPDVVCEFDAVLGSVTCWENTGSIVDAEGRIVTPDGSIVDSASSVAGLPAATTAIGSEIRVSPGQSIQDAIDQAEDGDRIVVEPGVYVENLNFLGKAITVESEQGPATTVINGGGAGAIVEFRSEEGRDSILRGFTLTNGTGSEGGAIGVFGASPSILDNVISDNMASFAGGGIGLGFASPLIQGNTIVRNRSQGGLGGGGISIRGASTAEIIGNWIAENISGEGGAISLFAGGDPLIQDNLMRENVSTTHSSLFGGGGVSMVNRSDADIIQNLIVENVATRGAGLSWLVPSGARGPLLVNNTIAFNDGTIGSAINADGYDQYTLLVNNILVAKDNQTALYCGDFNDPNSPIIRFNDIFSPLGDAYGGICSDQTGVNGNISDAPFFVDPAAGDYHLGFVSTLIDAGDNLAQGLPDEDLDGKERVVDGNGDSLAIVDIGAYEYFATNTPPTALCQEVTADADADCRADADIDDGSFDPDGDPITLDQSPPGPYGLGDTLVTLVVTDDLGASDSCVATVTVEDSTPPELSAALTPQTLWPPNHRMVDVAVSVVVSDACGTPSVLLTSVSSSEDDNGAGDGNTIDDIQDADVGTSDFGLRLRAERAGGGNGRIYTAIYTASDAAGNADSAAGFAVVPHDQGGMTDALELLLEERESGTLARWNAASGAVSYDVIRGRLGNIVETAAVIDLGLVTCIEADSIDESTAGWEDPDLPISGQIYFYLVEYDDGTSSSYGTESADKPRAPGAGDCR